MRPFGQIVSKAFCRSKSILALLLVIKIISYVFCYSQKLKKGIMLASKVKLLILSMLNVRSQEFSLSRIILSIRVC